MLKDTGKGLIHYDRVISLTIRIREINLMSVIYSSLKYLLTCNSVIVINCRYIRKVVW